MSMPLEELPNSPPDTSALERMVDRYACKEHPRYRVMIGAGLGGDAAMRELLLEIDQTMLPRRISVHCSPHEDLTLYVSNRRLFDVKKRGAPPARPPQSPKDAARVFASILRGAIHDADGLVLQEPQALAQFDEVGVSVSTALLADVLGLREAAEPALRIDGTQEDFSLIRDASIASLLATPSLSFSEAKGTQNEIAQLQNFWLDYVRRTGLAPNRGRIKHRDKECFVVPINRDTHLVVATKDEKTWCLALVPRQRLQWLTEVIPG